MFVKSGTIFNVKNIEKIKKIATKNECGNYVFKAGAAVFNSAMSKFYAIKAETDTVFSEKQPIQYCGWCWYPWMLEIPETLFEIE